MNEGAGMFGGGAYGGGGGPVYVVGAGQERRHYPLEALQLLRPAAPPARRWPRRDRLPPAKADATAFGYDSDDSSLSSNASGSNKSGEKVYYDSGEGPSRGERGAGAGGGGFQREWRGRRREPRQRRIAPERYLNASYPFQVKFTPDDLLNGSEWDTLSQEIWDKFVKSQQTEETFRNKMNLWRYLYITIKSIFPRYGLYVVGSTMSGFGLDSSDMDLCLYVRPPDNLEPRAHALLHLNCILSYMNSTTAMGLDAELIQAKVPLLKLHEPRHGLRVDLNCNNVVGIRNTNLLYWFSTLDWRVRPLVALTKLWAQAHNINDARHCTLSSYSLTLMVIHFLQCGTSPAVLPRACAVGGPAPLSPLSPPLPAPAPAPPTRSQNRATLAELFLNLLKYYAEFPYEKSAISVRAGARVPVAECRAARAHKNDPHQWKLLCVEEPFDLTNTARSVYDPETFERIVETFRVSHSRLAASRRLADAWPQR